MSWRSHLEHSKYYLNDIYLQKDLGSTGSFSYLLLAWEGGYFLLWWLNQQELFLSWKWGNQLKPSNVRHNGLCLLWKEFPDPCVDDVLHIIEVKMVVPYHMYVRGRRKGMKQPEER